MKIRPVTTENYSKIYALLRQAFPGGNAEAKLVEALHNSGRPMHEWVAIHVNRAIAYIAFTNAYHGSQPCGLHLAPLAVEPEFQGQGIGSEMMRFALRQKVVKESAVFVLGKPGFYEKFGFTPCAMPICPFDKKNTHFLSLRNPAAESFTVGYEPEFGKPGK